MNDKEAVYTMQEGWDLLIAQARIIALLPLEEWLNAFDRADAVAPILDPTLYRQYIYSGKGEVIKSIIEAALPLKHAIEKARSDVLAGKVKG